MYQYSCWIFLTVFCSNISLCFANQNDKPASWELGVGMSAISAPEYTGSKKRQLHTLPFPYFSYESKKLSLSREGLKRELLKSNRWTLDLSFAGVFPVDSDESDMRQGMPDLDWVGLAGPAASYWFYQEGYDSLKFMLPFRLGITTDFRGIGYAGWESVPTLRLTQGKLIDDTKWEWFFDISGFYTSSRYNNYVYSVDQAFATADRPAYQTKQGNAGYEFLVGITRRKDNLWMGAFFRYRGIGDAVFSDSPLVDESDNFYAGFAVAWIIHSSDDN
jgi:outer membrane scaffolding protein for murein synthesis (MipA/OmpV family)